METNLLECPNGRYTFVGSVPESLCNVARSSTADIMGQNYQLDSDGVPWTAKAKVFDTATEARRYAQDNGVDLAN